MSSRFASFYFVSSISSECYRMSDTGTPSMADRKLGRKAIKTDSRTLRLSRYFTAELPPPPKAVGWAHGIRQFGMLMNDTLGDCTIAGVGHAVQVLTANATKEAVITDDMALRYYESWDGY